MKNILLSSILLIVSCSILWAQTTPKCNASVFLSIDFKGKKCLYAKPNSKMIRFLKQDFKNEDYITFKIIDKNDSMFYVSASYEIGGFISKGWIKKDKNIGIYSRAYNAPLKLYSKPSETSKICSIIKEYNPNMYIVIDCIGKWLKVKTIYKGKLYIGWMSPDMQCCNVYSTCN